MSDEPLQKSWFLRAEAVNLINFVEDTEDLSIVRGGSLLLLRAARQIQIRIGLKFPDAGATTVNSGASVAICQFTATESGARAVREDVERWLTGRSGFRHATFVVDLAPVPDEEKYALVIKALAAKNRWRQAQSASVVYPGLRTSVNRESVCEQDHIRPAARALPHGEVLSRASWVRHETGRKQRTGFYRNEAARCEISTPLNWGEVHFAKDLNAIGDDDRGPLSNKLAVIYLDGNDFRRKFAEKCLTPPGQRRASHELAKLQAEFLIHVLESMEGDAGWFTRAGERRFETLLWGGDELSFVVPAWRAFNFVHFFFEAANSWQPFENGVENLTHGCGIVFCGSKCHIHQASGLAHQLADFAKDVSRSHNLIAYEVLESFDHLGERVSADSLIARLPFLQNQTSGAQPMALPATAIPLLWNHTRTLRETLSRRQLHKVVRLLTHPDAAQRNRARSEINKLDGTPGLAEFKQALGDTPAVWYHLNQLWDYLGFEAWPEAENTKGGAQ